jgi:heptosyltransferase III
MHYSAHRILLIATRQIGDVLLVTPLLRSLRQGYPDAIIDVLVYDHKGSMLEGNPDYNSLISVAEHPTLSQYKNLFQHIFRRYDLVLSTLSGDRPLLYALLAAPQRLAIVPPPRWQDSWKRLTVHAYTELDNEGTHTVIQNLRLADLLGIPRCYDIFPPQSISPSLHKLTQLLPFPWQTQPFAVLHLLPAWHYKRWTLTGWTELVHYLTMHRELQIVLTGGSDFQEQTYLHAALLNLPPTVTNLAGQLSFGEITTLLKASTLYVGPDTAITHLAAATGIPTVAIYGPTNPIKWSPWPYRYALDQSPFRRKGTQQVGNVLLIQPIGGCVPCHQEGCERHKQSGSFCLEGLDSDTVIETMNRFGF